MSLRYMIDERNTTAETSLALYRTAVAWAARSGRRFEMRVERNRYPDPEEARRLTALGETTPAPDQQLFGRPSGAVFVKGVAGEDLARELTQFPAPADDLPGDVSPVEDVSIYLGERRVYAAFDYGSTQLFELTEDELEDLRQTLTDHGLDPAYVVPAPESRKLDP
jgi:hypothetical protein